MNQSGFSVGRCNENQVANENFTIKSCCDITQKTCNIVVLCDDCDYLVNAVLENNCIRSIRFSRP